MKKFIVPVLSVCFFMSCSTDDTALNTVETTTTDSAFDQKITQKNLTIIENPANAFDFVGQLYVEILDDYIATYGEEGASSLVVNNVEFIAKKNTGFESICTTEVSLDENQVLWLLENINYPATIVEGADLSFKGKQLLMNFIAMLDSFENTPYTQVYGTIRGFEDTVINDTSLTDTDMQVILSTSSVARYSIAYGDARKRWWKNTRSGIVGSVNADTPAEAILMSASTDLLSE